MTSHPILSLTQPGSRGRSLYRISRRFKRCERGFFFSLVLTTVYPSATPFSAIAGCRGAYKNVVSRFSPNTDASRRSCIWQIAFARSHTGGVFFPARRVVKRRPRLCFPIQFFARRIVLCKLNVYRFYTRKRCAEVSKFLVLFFTIIFYQLRRFPKNTQVRVKIKFRIRDFPYLMQQSQREIISLFVRAKTLFDFHM